MKSAEEIMEILDAYDLTGSLRDAAELAGCSHHTVKRYVEAREKKAGPPALPVRREQLIDPFVAKVEEWVDRSHGKVRADRVTCFSSNVAFSVFDQSTPCGFGRWL